MGRHGRVLMGGAGWVVMVACLIFFSVVGNVRAVGSGADIVMTAAGPASNGKIITVGEEIKMGQVLVRTKNAKGGGKSLLLKNVGEETDAVVFGRKIHMGKDGQYLLKWSTGEEKLTTASVGVSGGDWEAGEDVEFWFRPEDRGADTKAGGGKVSEFKNIDMVKGAAPKWQTPTTVEVKKDSEGEETDERKPRKVEFKKDDKGGGEEVPVFKPIPKISALIGDSVVPKKIRYGAEAKVLPLDNKSENEYVIQPGDTVDLDFYRTQRVTVDMRGDIRVAAAVGTAESTIHAAGKTPREISGAVTTSGLNFRSLLDPALKVSVSKFADRSIVVLGNVRDPGRIPLDEGEVIGIPGAIKKAGGVSGGQGKAVVYVKRGDKITKADLGRSDETALNLFRIMPGDIMTVTRNND